MRQKIHFGSIDHVRIQLVQIGLQRCDGQHLTVACPYNASQQVEMHLQTPRNKFANRK
jgi:hypothetical protein